MLALKTAIFNRWNDAGLGTSITKLYPAGESKSGRNSFGPPPKSELPRAQYFVTASPPSRTRGSRYFMAAATLTAFGSSDVTVSGWLDSMRSAFVNSEKAATSPMTMTGGNIMDVGEGGSHAYKVDDGVFMAQLILAIRYRIRNEVPA